MTAPGVALAQAIGRWGNYFNQELYGKPTNLPWKIYIDPFHRVPGYENYNYFHPSVLLRIALECFYNGIIVVGSPAFCKLA